MPTRIIRDLRTLALIETRTGLQFNTMFRYCISPISHREEAILAELGYELVSLDGLSCPFLAKKSVESPRRERMEQTTPVEPGEFCPTTATPLKVIIHVEGGLVQAVYSSKELDIQVYDLDVSSHASKREIEEMKTIAAELETAIRNMQQIY